MGIPGIKDTIFLGVPIRKALKHLEVWIGMPIFWKTAIQSRRSKNLPDREQRFRVLSFKPPMALQGSKPTTSSMKFACRRILGPDGDSQQLHSYFTTCQLSSPSAALAGAVRH